MFGAYKGSRKNCLGSATHNLLHGGASRGLFESLADAPDGPGLARARRAAPQRRGIFKNAIRGAPVNSGPNETQSMTSEIIDVIASEGMIPREKLEDDATIESLGLKSIDIVMILTAIEEKFDVYIPMDGSFQEAKDLKGLVDAISAHILREKAAK
jgi:acyl carrier protein